MKVKKESAFCLIGNKTYQIPLHPVSQKIIPEPFFANSMTLANFALLKMVDVVQLVRTSDCDSEGRGFEPHHSPQHNWPASAGFLLSSIGRI